MIQCSRFCTQGAPLGVNLRMSNLSDGLVWGYGWGGGPALEQVEKYPNPPAPNITQFKTGGG